VSCDPQRARRMAVSWVIIFETAICPVMNPIFSNGLEDFARSGLLSLRQWRSS
jgi:hypothetical protein